MTPQYVRSAFRRAGFPLTNGGYGNRCWQYVSSPLRIIYNPGHTSMDLPIIRVYWNGNLSEFDSVAKTLRLIRGRMAMAYVPGNDFALNTGPRGQLRLVESEAA